MMARESDVSGVRLRRGLAGLEFLLAALTVLVGIGFATADRVGGDGIATGIANQYGPVFVLIGLIIGHAARVAWRGSPRWWGWPENDRPVTRHCPGYHTDSDYVE
jgi:hypothetical protein